MRFLLGIGVSPVLYLVKPHFRRRARYALSLDGVDSLARPRRQTGVVRWHSRRTEAWKFGLDQTHDLGQGPILD